MDRHRPDLCSTCGPPSRPDRSAIEGLHDYRTQLLVKVGTASQRIHPGRPRVSMLALLPLLLDCRLGMYGGASSASLWLPVYPRHN